MDKIEERRNIIMSFKTLTELQFVNCHAQILLQRQAPKGFHHLSWTQCSVFKKLVKETNSANVDSEHNLPFSRNEAQSFGEGFIIKSVYNQFTAVIIIYFL
jgi:hypothetical protein